MPAGRAIVVGRACGVAAGTLLAFGSVLAGAAKVGDGSLAGTSAALPPAPGVDSGASAEYQAPASAEPASAAPDPVSAQALADETRPAPQPRLGPVRRNNPVFLDVPAEASPPTRTEQQPWDSRSPAADPPPDTPIAPVNPVLDPAASEVDRIAPVEDVLGPESARGGQASDVGVHDQQASRVRHERPTLPAIPVVEPVDQVVAPLDDVTQPARATLGALLAIG